MSEARKGLETQGPQEACDLSSRLLTRIPTQRAALFCFLDFWPNFSLLLSSCESEGGWGGMDVCSRHFQLGNCLYQMILCAGATLGSSDCDGEVWLGIHTSVGLGPILTSLSFVSASVTPNLSGLFGVGGAGVQ